MNSGKDYSEGRVAVDAVILTVLKGEILVYLRSREKQPFKNLLELPGGLLLPNETAENTLDRKLRDLTGVSGLYFRQFNTFTHPKRDPRQRTVSIGFVALLSSDKIADFKKFHPVTTLPKLAFDHNRIVTAACEFLKTNQDDQVLTHLMPPRFPLNDLQTVYESLTGKKMDNRNFRKKVLDSGLIVKARLSQVNVAHRPAALYKFRRA